MIQKIMETDLQKPKADTRLSKEKSCATAGSLRLESICVNCSIQLHATDYVAAYTLPTENFIRTVHQGMELVFKCHEVNDSKPNALKLCTSCGSIFGRLLNSYMQFIRATLFGSYIYNLRNGVKVKEAAGIDKKVLKGVMCHQLLETPDIAPDTVVNHVHAGAPKFVGITIPRISSIQTCAQTRQPENSENPGDEFSKDQRIQDFSGGDTEPHNDQVPIRTSTHSDVRNKGKLKMGRKYTLSKFGDDAVKKRKPDIQFGCHQCKFQTKKKSNLERHTKTHNKAHNCTLLCPEQGCSILFNTFDKLDEHLIKVHARKLETEYRVEENEETFKSWMTSLKENEFCTYLNKSSSKRTSGRYYCAYSSQFKRPSRATGKRHGKKIGSNKSEHTCTSRIIVVPKETGLHIIYHKTHSGHPLDPRRVGLSIPQKREIAELLIQGVPRQHVLKCFREKHRGVVNRAANINMDDIYNIARKCQRKSVVPIEENNASSIDCHRRALDRENVILPKTQTAISEDNPNNQDHTNLNQQNS